MSRDSQKQRVYSAEQKFLRPYVDDYLGDVAQCQLFINQVMRRKYIAKHYPTGLGWPIRVVGIPSKHRWAHAYCGASRIEVGTGDAASWSRTKSVMLHELAHILAFRKYLDHSGSHNWQFAAVFLDLVRNVMGKEAAARLKAGYKVHRVRCTEPRKRTMTPAQKDAAAARLENARAKREAKLAPKRIMKERAIKLHGKRRLGLNNFNKPCYEHWLGSGDRKFALSKDPRYMTYDQIECVLRGYDNMFRMYDESVPEEYYADVARAGAIKFETRMLLQATRPNAMISQITGIV